MLCGCLRGGLLKCTPKSEAGNETDQRGACQIKRKGK